MTAQVYPLQPGRDEVIYRMAWDWMQAQRQIYDNVEGVEDFARFSAHGPEQADYSIESAAGQVLAFVELVRDALGRCEVVLITPPQPQVFAILRGLRWIERAFKQANPQGVFYVRSWERGAVLARRFGLKQAEGHVYYG
jgi:hypothetical protein